MLLVDFRQAARAAADIAVLARGVAKDECIWRNISCNNRSRTDQGKLPDSEATENNRSRTDGCAVLHQRWRNLPIIRALELAIGSNGARQQVVRETRMRANENAILEGNPFEH